MEVTTVENDARGERRLTKDFFASKGESLNPGRVVFESFSESSTGTETEKKALVTTLSFCETGEEAIPSPAMIHLTVYVPVDSRNCISRSSVTGKHYPSQISFEDFEWADAFNS